MPGILDQIHVLEILEWLQSSFWKEHEVIAVELPVKRYIQKHILANSVKKRKKEIIINLVFFLIFCGWITDIRWSLGTGSKTSCGSVVKRLLLRASHSNWGSPMKASESISRRLLESMNNFSSRSMPVNTPDDRFSNKFPPMCSSCNCPRLLN